MRHAGVDSLGWLECKLLIRMVAHSCAGRARLKGGDIFIFTCKYTLSGGHTHHYGYSDSKKTAQMLNMLVAYLVAYETQGEG